MSENNKRKLTKNDKSLIGILAFIIIVFCLGILVGIALERQRMFEYCVRQGYDGYSEFFKTCTYTDCIKGGNPIGIRE